MADVNDIVVGIDLGSTKSAVAVYCNGNLQIIKITDNKTNTQQPVFLSDEALLKLSETNVPKEEDSIHNIPGVSRLIGRKFDDPEVQKHLEQLSFDVESDENNPVIVIDQPNGQLRKTPLEIYSCILAGIKKEVQNALETNSQIKAVITVPGHFDIAQRKAVREAARDVGFNVLQLLNKPTAVALAYVFFEGGCFKSGDYFLVYHLGSCSFDAVIYQKFYYSIQAVAAIGDNFLGGSNFDNLILNYVCNYLRKQFNFDIKEDKEKLKQLRLICEAAKEALSYLDDVTIRATNFIPGAQICDIIITRNYFESLIENSIIESLRMIFSCLEENRLLSSIDYIILSGGSTRIPMVKDFILSSFTSTIVNFVYQDSTTAEGAAIQAGLLSTSPKQFILMPKINDITSYTIGLKGSSNLMLPVIQRNTSIPCEMITPYSLVDNLEKCLTFVVYEGERTNCKKNRYLTTVKFPNFTPSAETQIQTMIKVDRSGIVSFYAREKLKFSRKNLDAVYTQEEESQSDVKNTLLDSHMNQQEDEDFIEFAVKRERLSKSCKIIMCHINPPALKQEEPRKNNVCKKTTEKTKMTEESNLDKWTRIIQKLCLNIVTSIIGFFA